MLQPSIIFKWVYLICIGFCFCTTAGAQPSLIEKAYQAYEKKQLTTLKQTAQQLSARGDDLAPYAHYWLIKRNFKLTSVANIQQLMQQSQDYPFYPQLQAMQLKKLGKAGQWAAVLQASHDYRGNDVGVQCRVWEAKAKQLGQINRAAVKSLWYYPKKRPSDCNGLFNLMRVRQVIQYPQLHTRIRMAALNGQRQLAKELSVQLPGINRKTARLFDRARKNPKRFLSRRVASFHKPLGVTLNLYALDRLARKNPSSAAMVLQGLQQHFSQHDRLAAWEVVAYRAARNLHPNALRYYQRAYRHQDLPDTLQKNEFYLERLAWRARAALRKEDWSALLAIIEQMPAEQQKRARWRYWSARAMRAVYRDKPQYRKLAGSLLTTLGQERHYYGWLAAEAMQMPKLGYRQQPKPIDEVLVKQVANDYKIQRAVALHQSGVHRPARKAWYAAINGYSDQQYLAAAIYAQRLGWNDVSINTADRTQSYHDFNLRYQAPYKKLFKIAAASEGIDQSWVLGLVRQESRFIDYAKSRVGAAGLMQLMPKTARWVAKKKGLRGYRRSKLYEVPTNITLGTYYMRYTLDLLGGNAVLATAGYNAGPSRALKWMADRPLEGAIYIETIPFDETRNYVQRVMANAHFYETRVGVPSRTMTQRIGIIPAKQH